MKPDVPEREERLAPFVCIQRRIALATFVLAGVRLFSAEPDRAAMFQAAFAVPAAETATISPDGKRVAMVTRVGLGARVRIFDLGSASNVADFASEDQTLVLVNAPQLRWLDAARLLVCFGRYDLGMVENAGKNFRWLAGRHAREWETENGVGKVGLRIAALPKAEPEVVYVTAYDAIGAPGGHREAVVAKVHLRKDKYEWVWREKLVDEVFVDAAGRARVWRESMKDGERFYVRAPEGKSGEREALDEKAPGEASLHFDRTLADYFGHHTTPLAFDRDTNTLLIASNVNRDTVGIYGFDLETGRRTELALERPEVDLAPLHSAPSYYKSDLVFDPANERLVGVRYSGEKRSAVWLDDDLRTVQEKVEALRPMHGVQIENWDDAREQFLVLLSHRADPGIYAVYSRSTNQLHGYIPLRPQPAAAPRLHATPWKIMRPDGRTLTGHLTLPRVPAKKPIPVIAYFQPQPWMRVPTDYSGDVATLAMMGYAVVEVNHRGVAGLGLDHWLAGRTAPDVAAAEDVFAAIDRLAGQAGLDVRRVALFGARFGGMLALRAAQLFPDRVMCVATLDAETDLSVLAKSREGVTNESAYYNAALLAYFGPTREALVRRSPITHVAELTQPVLLVNVFDDYTGPIKALRASLKTVGREPVWVDVTGRDEFAVRRARAAVAIEQFFGKHLTATKP